ncbi:hypothetical protein CIK81_07495 [Brachybacterium sp. JB7]|uniref:Uncharacterized protein n=1 Tax=Brachybacterium alimentarium TaxID=47845 RepID=A0A2A3YK99_9MICO|nr:MULTISPECIES: hypothetical protein [Brachybacterium]PCC31574.1 hypothetical protein CIK71_14495 [Brachybacterium alimentarium]PCC39659.1 hypothetical protein CIK66_08085 [Brachybacterium alimentarium]RCS65138.1 hypothetical protein CIK81_07495 [Brachybacterium sp. JB7]RCS76258.1 hypothetical protein CIK68_03395 [Brachybacterium alimentarium]RCS76481.1 hypothetical protein CIK70_15155 [Brachybacterium alimentarium]
MPSYRMHLPIGDLHPGATPADVMEQAALALGSLHMIEKRDVEAPLVDGRRVGRVVLRYVVDPLEGRREDDTARHAVHMVIDHLERTTATISPPRAVLLTRGGGRFRPISWR